MSEYNILKKLEYNRALKNFENKNILEEKYKTNCEFAKYVFTNMENGDKRFLSLLKKFDKSVTTDIKVIYSVLENTEIKPFFKDKEFVEKFAKMDDPKFVNNVLYAITNGHSMYENKKFIYDNFKEFANKCENNEIVVIALKYLGYHNIVHLSDKYTKNDKFVKSVLTKDLRVLRCVDEKYYKDHNLLANIVENIIVHEHHKYSTNEDYYRYIRQLDTLFTLGNEGIKNDKEIISKYRAIKYASKEVRDDKDFVLDYMKNIRTYYYNRRVLDETGDFYCLGKLRNDPDVALIAIEKYPDNIQYAGPNILLNKKFVDFALSLRDCYKPCVYEAVLKAELKYGKLSEKERIELFNKECLEQEENFNLELAKRKEEELKFDFEDKNDKDYAAWKLATAAEEESTMGHGLV